MIFSEKNDQRYNKKNEKKSSKIDCYVKDLHNFVQGGKIEPTLVGGQIKICRAKPIF